MAFKKAPKRKSNTDVIPKSTSNKAQSTQERFAAGTGARKVSMGSSSAPGMRYMSAVRDTGNQMKSMASKGTGVLKEPTAVALSSRDLILPAVQNPSGEPSRTSNSRKAKMRK